MVLGAKRAVLISFHKRIVGNRPACSFKQSEMPIMVEAGLNPTIYRESHDAGSEASSIDLPPPIVVQVNAAAGDKPQPYKGVCDTGSTGTVVRRGLASLRR